MAVSGTASLFLTPVLLAGLVMGRRVPVWAFSVSFAAAMAGAVTYFARGAVFAPTPLAEWHKYEQLLAICVVVLLVGCATVFASARRAG